MVAAEGLRVALAIEGSVAKRFVAFALACGLSALVISPPSVLVVLLASLRVVRSASVRLLVADAPRRAATLLGLAVVVPSAALAVFVRKSVELGVTTESVAALGVLGTTLAVGAVARAIHPALTRRFRGLDAGDSPVARLTSLRAQLGFLAVASLFLPRSAVFADYDLAPRAAIAFFACWMLFSGAVRRLAPSWVGFAALLPVLGVGSVLFFPRVPVHLRSEVVHASAYVAWVVETIRTNVDFDDDGHSSQLAGGDCDDGDPARHPSASEVPQNGVDEDCSGTDAAAFHPVSAPRFEGDPEPRLNIVMVLVDTLRPDHLGFAGYHRPTSPELDRFRESATWFRRVYSPGPSTRYALSSIFTGLEIELLPNTRARRSFRLHPSAVTLAERLTESGYDAMGYTITWVLEHTDGIGQGFREWTTPWPRGEGPRVERRAQDAPMTTDASLRYLDSVPADGTARPFFLFAHYQCTHFPYYVPGDDWRFGDSPVDRYDSALAHCDRQIGRLLRGLETRSDYDRTAVIVFSDHGEMLGEHGESGTHGLSLYEPGVRSVLLVRVPGAHRGLVDHPVSLTDLAPTVASLANVPAVGSEAAWDLVPFVRPGDLSAVPDRPLFLFAEAGRAALRSELRGVVDGPYKLVRDLRDGSEMLFDVEADAAESTDLSGALPEVRQRLAGLVEARSAWLAERLRASSPQARR